MHFHLFAVKVLTLIALVARKKPHLKRCQMLLDKPLDRYAHRGVLSSVCLTKMPGSPRNGVSIIP